MYKCIFWARNTYVLEQIFSLEKFPYKSKIVIMIIDDKKRKLNQIRKKLSYFVEICNLNIKLSFFDYIKKTSCKGLIYTRQCEI